MKKAFLGIPAGFTVFVLFLGCTIAYKTITETEAFPGKWFLSGKTPPGISYTRDTTLTIYEFNSNMTFTWIGRTNSGVFQTNTGTYVVDEVNNLMIMYTSITCTNHFNFIDSQLWQKISNMYVIDYSKW